MRGRAEVGEIVRARRKSLGMSQKELARRLGVYAPTLCRWERGERGMPASALAAACEILGMSADELLGTDAGGMRGELVRVLYLPCEGGAYRVTIERVDGLVVS